MSEIIEPMFKHKGVDFEVLQRNDDVVLLKASAPFYDCDSLEVWKVRWSKEREIKGNIVPKHERKPSNEDYPMFAKQFMQKRYTSYEEMLSKAMTVFNKWTDESKDKDGN